ncbi:NCS2 family permease [Amorphus orientalis]|uniref:AGZA family xanthine/uracil permease-like MFS transporter n=1 Tax=Amorphus orientalis TaxID=649198 RepID=A0AAE4ASV6_9HYPH|nr:NCS2 family permease [Amorphus orientalis]MDQ0316676.1 AGZA family xanthine/uracil permease-like MFS transporter [Amorphus orientalis]
MTEPKTSGPAAGSIDRFFNLTANGTSVRKELVAGLTTFLTMAYILFVNPSILGAAGMPEGSVFVATAVAAIAGTLIMALVANYPIALAPGMGLNAFFAFTVVLAYNFTWQEALAAVFCSGVIFVGISVIGLRRAIIDAIPENLKRAISAGIGLFLGIIAFENAGIVVDSPATLVTAGDFASAPVLLAILGFVLIAALNSLGILGGTIIGILIVTVLGIPLGLVELNGLVSLPPDPTPTLFALDFAKVATGTFWIVVFSLLLVDLFDTAGTLIGVSARAGLLDKEGRLPRMKQALLADSSATVIGSLVGTSNTTSYVESATGVAAGGRTGLTSLTVAVLFALGLFFAPLAGAIPAYATAGALLFVATLMLRGLAEIDWSDPTEVTPAVVCAIGMPFTYSISDGIGLGFITYVLVKLFSGRIRDLTPFNVAIAVVFGLFFIWG